MSLNKENTQIIIPQEQYKTNEPTFKLTKRGRRVIAAIGAVLTIGAFTIADKITDQPSVEGQKLPLDIPRQPSTTVPEILVPPAPSVPTHTIEVKRTESRHKPRTTTTTEKAEFGQITPEMRKEVEQSALQVVRRVKGGSGKWDTIGSASVVVMNNKKHVLAAAHEFDPFNEYPKGNGPPEDMAKSSGYEFGFIKPGSDPNSNGVLAMAKKIAVSKNTKYDLALIEADQATASVAFNAMTGLKISDNEPQIDQAVVSFGGNENSGYKPSVQIGEIASGELSPDDGRSVYAVNSDQDSFTRGASGQAVLAVNGAIGVVSSSLQNASSSYTGAVTFVTPEILAPFESVVASS